jgi:hypothetical protein
VSANLVSKGRPCRRRGPAAATAAAGGGGEGFETGEHGTCPDTRGSEGVPVRLGFDFKLAAASRLLILP